MNDPATKLPPLSVGAIAHMEGEDHLYGTAFRERTRQLSLALELLRDTRAALDACQLQMLQSNNDSEYAQEANELTISVRERIDGSGLLGEIGSGGC